jgi:hypothetical protein
LFGAGTLVDSSVTIRVTNRLEPWSSNSMTVYWSSCELIVPAPY